MATLEINGRRVEVDDSFRTMTPDQQHATVDEIAASMGQPGAAPASAAAAAPAEAPNRSGWDRFTDAAAGIVNDIGAAFQGVNPIALSEKRGQAVGVLRDDPSGNYVDVDGTREPVGNYPPDRFVTRLEGGTSYVYPRTSDIEESRLASAGRAAGYGVISQLPRAATEAARAAPMAQDAADIGVTPSFAMRNPVARSVAAAGKQFGPTAGRFADDSARVSTELGEAASRIAAKAGSGATPVEAGEAIQDGAKTFITEFRGRERALYKVVDTAIPPKTTVTAPATTAFLEKEAAKFADLPEIAKAVGSPRLTRLLDDITGGNLTWESARALRTEIGEAVGKISGPLADTAQGKLKSLYGTLSTDLDAAAKAAGPEASRAWSRATTYSRAANERIERALSKVTGAPSPEAAYSRVMAMTADGASSANVRGLNDMFKSLPREDRAVVAGTIIRRMGQATAGAQDAAGEVFSPATFLTNWNKMSPQARGVVGAHGLDKGVGQELTKLARVVDAAKKAGALDNSSNTGNAVITFLLGGAAIADMATTGLGVVGAHVTARALTNERFLRGLNQYAASGRPAMLRQLARSQTPLALEAATVLRLTGAEASPPLQLPAPSPATR